jgi:hypothetical protein
LIVDFWCWVCFGFWVAACLFAVIGVAFDGYGGKKESV